MKYGQYNSKSIAKFSAWHISADCPVQCANNCAFFKAQLDGSLSTRTY